MEEREILLPLEREYTEKEQIGFLKQQNQNLVNQLMQGHGVNKELKRKLQQFTDGKILPPGWIHEKTHVKLLNKYHDLNKRFWEIVKEFNDYKKHIEVTVLNHVKK